MHMSVERDSCVQLLTELGCSDDGCVDVISDYRLNVVNKLFVIGVMFLCVFIEEGECSSGC